MASQCVVALAAARGEAEVNAILGEGFGESDPAYETLLHAAISGSPPTGLAEKRASVRKILKPDTGLGRKGDLCAQVGAFICTPPAGCAEGSEAQAYVNAR
jgi:hypothetical protein